MALTLTTEFTRDSKLWRERPAHTASPPKPSRLSALTIQPVPPSTTSPELPAPHRLKRVDTTNSHLTSAVALPPPHGPLGDTSVAYHMGKARSTGSQMKALKAFLSQNTPHPPALHRQYSRRLGVLATALTTEEKRALREALPPDVELSFFVERRDKLLPQDVGRFPVYIKEHVPNNRTTLTMPTPPTHVKTRGMQEFVSQELEAFEHRKHGTDLQRLISMTAIAAPPERRLRWTRQSVPNIHDDHLKRRRSSFVDRTRSSVFLPGDEQSMAGPTTNPYAVQQQDNGLDDRATLILLLSLERVRSFAEQKRLPRAVFGELYQKLVTANVLEVNPRKEPGYIWQETFLNIATQIPLGSVDPVSGIKYQWREFFRIFDGGASHARLQPLMRAVQWAASDYDLHFFIAVCLAQLASVPFVTTAEYHSVRTAIQNELAKCPEEKRETVQPVAAAVSELTPFFTNAERLDRQYFRKALLHSPVLVETLASQLNP